MLRHSKHGAMASPRDQPSIRSPKFLIAPNSVSKGSFGQKRAERVGLCGRKGIPDITESWGMRNLRGNSWAAREFCPLVREKPCAAKKPFC